jgi:hypothetical protein
MGSLDLDSIYKDIGTFGTIGLKHRVVLFSKDTKTGKNKPYEQNFVSNKSKGGKCGYNSIYYRSTTESIILETRDFDTKDDIKLKNSIYLTYNDIGEIERVCKEVTSWFENPQIKNDLFQYENNNPYKISDKYMQLHSIMYPAIGLNRAFLVIQPAVITDFKTRMGYPGVIIKSISGVVGCCTITEFKSLSKILISNLRDLYKISLDLMNHYMLDKLIGGK